MKNLYLAFVLALAHIIRLSRNGADVSGGQTEKSILFGITEVSLPLEKNQEGDGVQMRRAWVVAYLYNEAALTFSPYTRSKEVSLQKNSLKVIIFKIPEDFEKDNPTDKEKNYYKVQKGELIGAFENGKDWSSDEKIDDSFTFSVISEIRECDWTHYLSLTEFEYDDGWLFPNWRWLHRIKGTLGSRIIPLVRKLKIVIKALEVDPNSPQEIKFGEKTEFEFQFLIRRFRNRIKHEVKLTLTVHNEEKLLQALEAKWDEGTKTNDKTYPTPFPLRRDLGRDLLSQGFNRGYSNAAYLSTQGRTGNGDVAQSQLNQGRADGVISQKAVMSEDAQIPSPPPISDKNQPSDSFAVNPSNDMESLTGQNPEINQAATSQDQKLASTTGQPGSTDSQRSIDSLELDSSLEGQSQEQKKNGGERDKEQKSDKKPESSASQEED